VPSVTDIVVALGQRDRLRGRTDYDFDPALRALPSVGGTIDPSVERMVALRPDLVVTWDMTPPPAAQITLARLPIPTVAVGTETFSELWTTIDTIGTLLDCRTSADSLRRAILDTLAAVRQSASGGPHPRVLYVVQLTPPMVAGAATFLNDLIAVAGGVNAFADVAVAWPLVDMETIVGRNPDVIVWPIAAGGDERVSALQHLPGWALVPAVRAGRVLLVDRDLFDRPGPAIGRAARALATGLAAPRRDARKARKH
jgi:ABC-type Fe3+-hydroxamate transport system substrate-binding protein